MTLFLLPCHLELKDRVLALVGAGCGHHPEDAGQAWNKSRNQEDGQQADIRQNKCKPRFLFCHPPDDRRPNCGGFSTFLELVMKPWPPHDLRSWSTDAAQSAVIRALERVQYDFSRGTSL